MIVLLRRELYVSCALVGASVFVALEALGLSDFSAGMGGFVAAFLVRAAAIFWGWMLPAFPGRGGDKSP